MTDIFNASVYFYELATGLWTCRDLATIALTMDAYSATDSVTNDYWEHMAY